ncbi:hypothetical protein ASE69_13685 [Sphingomonas sp. Leaf208]|jgi:hypothetical protein|nr:hypothetical protein ASE69_13685 [Sphingomonas sp. Leaf208]
MSDFSWTKTCTMHTPSRDVGIKTTLNAVPADYKALSATAKTRASVTTDDPIDLGDGRGPVTEMEGEALDRLCDLFEQFRASLARQ